MRPSGRAALGGAQVIRDRDRAPLPDGCARARCRSPAATRPPRPRPSSSSSSAAAAARPTQVIVLAADAPRALQMPAAGLAAESGAPILFVTAGARARGDRRGARDACSRPSIYVVGAAARRRRARSRELARFGRVTRDRRRGRARAEREQPGRRTRSPSPASPTARSAGGSKNPGTASCSRTRRARSTRPPPRLLSATGDYGPLLLLEGADRVPAALARYLSDIQPAYTRAAVPAGARRLQSRLADRRRTARSRRVTQAELDAMLEIAPRTAVLRRSVRARPPNDDRPRAE